jgi:rubredoxin
MSENPLKQYFRRPAIYIKLPSNYEYYDSDVIAVPENGELPVYPMTAIDEITSRTPDALFNGTAVVDIIKSCIPAIKNPWKINIIDMESILIAIRVASTGENMDIDSACPSCKEVNKYGVNLVDLLGTMPPIDYNKTLKIRDLEVKFHPLSYSETNKNDMAQYNIQKVLAALDSIEDPEEKTKKSQEAIQYLTSATNDAIVSTIAYIKTPETTVTNVEFIKEFLLGCDRQTSSAIIDFSVELRSKSQLKPLRVRCTSCQHEYDQQIILNVTDFFV